MLTVLQTALEVGLIYGLVALALFISFSILNIADLSTDGCFTLGCAVGAMLTIAGHPILALFAAMAAGMLSGYVTAFLQTRLGVESILAGIISNTGLYTINLAVMGFSSNVSITGVDTVFSLFKGLVGGQWSRLILLALIAAVIVIVLIRFSARHSACPSAPRATVSIWSALPPSTPKPPSRSACAWPTLSRRCPAA